MTQKYTYEAHINGASIRIEVPAPMTEEEIWEFNFRSAQLLMDKIRQSQRKDDFVI